MADKKTCAKCQIDYPLNKDFWHRDNHASDGFRSTCKMCRSEELESKRKDYQFKKATEDLKKLNNRIILLEGQIQRGGLKTTKE